MKAIPGCRPRFASGWCASSRRASRRRGSAVDPLWPQGWAWRQGPWGGTLGAPLLGLLAPSRPPPVATTQPSARADASRGSIEPRSELARWVDTGLNITELAEGIPRRVSAGAVSAFVVRRGARVVGMSSLCTHLPCELVWQSNMKVLNCPCHDLNFDVNGRSMSEGYPLPALPLVKVRVRNDGGVEVLGA